MHGSQCKPHMMGIPTSGPSYICGDNASAIDNSSKPDSTLNKMSNQVCCHSACELVAMGECLVTHIPTGDNLGDLATKFIPGGVERSRLVNVMLHDIESNSAMDAD